MRKSKFIWTLALVTFVLCTPFAYGVVPIYLDESEYQAIKDGQLYEDYGIVIENQVGLGYLTYKNGKGEQKTVTYYKDEIEVEKSPYYEQEDRIGYIDQIFPNFSFDSRDTTISSIKPGDNIYIQLNNRKEVQYISAYNEYIMRYGKVHTWDYGNATLVLEDEKGKLYTYTVDENVPITKNNSGYSLGQLKQGEWIKILVSQKVLGPGVLEEEIEEIVVDGQNKLISHIYRGELVNYNQYKGLLGLKYAQAIGKTGWGAYTNLLTLKVDPKTVQSYYQGNPVGFSWVQKQTRMGIGNLYVATEQANGQEKAVKLNFQNKSQSVLPATRIIDASAGVIKLLTGETLYISNDALIVRDKRLVDSRSLLVGDYVQVVVTGENKVAIANVLQEPGDGGLQILRGRIKKIKDYSSFEVETFSKLEDNSWYYQPQPRAFTIGQYTKFYDSNGFIKGGIESFLDYGEESKYQEVYTIVAQGNEAKSISIMPYTNESVKGEVYAVDGTSIKIKNVYYYHKNQKKWLLLSTKNYGATLELGAQATIIKNGKLISIKELEKGDRIKAMTVENVKDNNNKGMCYILKVEE